MRRLNIVPGTPEWDTERAKHNTASEAPAMMGVSPYVKRNELLHMKATGDEREFSEFVQTRILDKGHANEAATRPIAEAMVGEDLYPVVGVDDDDYLLASFDGITMSGKIIWENKQPNKEKLEAVEAGRCPECDLPQIAQQLYVNDKAEKCLYTLSDGTEETPPHVWVTRDMVDFDRLLAGWRQFDEDVKNYEPTETKPEPTGATPESLPALHIEVTGQVTASNLDTYKDRALAVFNSINTDLQTDEDFATAASTVKWLESVEKKLDAAKQHALSQTESIDELFKAIDDMREQARQKRLDLNKQVESQKKSRRNDILRKAQNALSAYIGELNQTLGSEKITLPEIQTDFAGVMKGKRTIASLQDAVDTELARAKIEANERANKIRANVQTLREDAKGFEALFADAQQIVQKDNEDLKNLIKARIDDHNAKQEQLEREKQETVESKPQPSQTPPAARPAPSAGRPVPSDDEIINAVARSFRCDTATAAEWILAMDTEALKQKVAA